MNTLEERMMLYMDARFPILYLETFEEEKIMASIKNAAENREIVELNVRGLFFHNNPDADLEGITLNEALEILVIISAPEVRNSPKNSICAVVYSF